MPPFATTTLMLVPLALVGLPDSTRQGRSSSCGTFFSSSRLEVKKAGCLSRPVNKTYASSKLQSQMKISGRDSLATRPTTLATGCSVVTSKIGHPFDLETNQRSQLPFNLPASEVKRIANAIYLAEGGKATRYPYGIKSVTIASTAEAEKVCWNTINHNWREFLLADAKTGNAKHFAIGGLVPKEFVDFLADHYCPKSCDKQGNENWKKNVWFFLRTGR